MSAAHRDLAAAILGDAAAAAALGLRQGVVSTTDPATWSVTVDMSGEVGNPVPCRVLGRDWPAVGQTVWVLRNGSDLLVFACSPSTPAYRVQAHRSTAQTIGTGFTNLAFDTDDSDVWDMHSVVPGSDHLFTVPIAGLWQCDVHLETGAQAGTRFDLQMVPTSGPSWWTRQPSIAGVTNTITASGPIPMAAGDTVYFQAAVPGGAVSTTAPHPYCEIRYVGPLP